MIELTDEYRAAAKEFRVKFGYGVPLAMIPPITKTEDLIEKIKDCVESGRDNLLDRYNVVMEDGILY